jgi:mRNA-degrading endonuclease toxin of MazEF toxin-antitoxin module
LTPHRIRQGDIYWLDDCEPLHGDTAKRRPVVVVSPDAAIAANPEVIVVACTSSALPSDVSAIELPNRQRTPQAKTGLTRRTWAIPGWLVPVSKRLLSDRIGFVPAATLRKLLEAVARGSRG